MNDLEKILYIDRLTSDLGDCPNLKTDTLGGKVFWQTLDRNDEMTLQQNYITGHCRILDTDNKRIAWGSEKVMREKFRRLSAPSFIEPGDVIGITRNMLLCTYDHYAVYIGNGQVIHYAGEGEDFSNSISIHQAPISDFKDEDENYFVLFFEDSKHAPKKIFRRSELLTIDSAFSNQLYYEGMEEFHIYSPEETIERAKSRLTESKYSLVFNNCEHFALWCKTGVSESFQVKQAVGSMLSLPEIIDQV